MVHVILFTLRLDKNTGPPIHMHFVEGLILNADKPFPEIFSEGSN